MKKHLLISAIVATHFLSACVTAPPLTRTNVELAISTELASDDDAHWSKAIKGMRARLSILPPESQESPFCRVYIELENVDNVAGQKKVRFDPDDLSLRITDKDGKELALANAPYSGMSSIWETIALPYSGNIKFQISFPRLGYSPGNDKVIIDVGVRKAWVIPQDGATYFLSGTLSIDREESDHPYMDWSGALELPNVSIPKSQQ